MKTLTACLITALIVSVSASWAQYLPFPGKNKGPVRGQLVCKWKSYQPAYTISRAK